MTAHDYGYQRPFSRPEMIRDLLIGFVREPWIADLDFATLERYPGEFIDDRLRQRRNDVIWRLRRGPTRRRPNRAAPCCSGCAKGFCKRGRRRSPSPN
jgi:hypothetical protein